MELIQEKRLYKLIFNALEKNRLHVPKQMQEGGPSGSSQLIEKGCLAVHDFYSDLFQEFEYLWKKNNPKDLMEFPRIFNNFKDKIRQMNPPLLG